MDTDDNPVSAVVFDFVEQYQRDLDRGERHDLNHYLRRFPGHADAIRAEFEALAHAESYPGQSATPPTRLGPYTIDREIGRGGQGMVYLATDTRFSREVALKVLPPAAFVSEARLKRFRREAEVVARLSHPCICNVLDADFECATPYIAMRFVPGHPLSDQVHENDPPDNLGIRNAIALVERAGRAIHAAHEAGVIHRDIKPANIMVTPDGEPVVLDFGLAREAGDVSLTEPGTHFGTLAYMAPEQLADDDSDGAVPVDRRTDVYALAVSLYELVTGHRPFEAKTRQVLATSIRTAEPRDPRAWNPKVPLDLAIVLAKALDKDPDRRYPTALEFSEDLRRVNDYEPILARRAGPWLRLRRWARRHPLLSMSTALTALLLTVGLIVSLVLLQRVRGERERYRALFFATYARKTVEEDPTMALLTAMRAAEIQQGFLVNTALYEALDACREERAIYPSGHPFAIHAKTLRAACVYARTGECILAQILPDGTSTKALEGSPPITAAAFNPDGTLLVTGCKDGTVTVFDAGNAKPVRTLPRLDAAITRVAVSANARHVATSSTSGETVVSDLSNGREMSRLGTGGSSHIYCELSPDGRSAITLDDSGTLASWDVLTGNRLANWSGPNPIRKSRIDPSGRFVAFSRDKVVVLSNLRTGNVIHRFTTPGDSFAHALAFDASSRLLAAGVPGRLLVYSTKDGTPVIDRDAHRRRTVWHISFNADATLLASAGVDSTVRVFELPSGKELHVFTMREPHLTQVEWTPDGQRLMSIANSKVNVHCLGERPGLLTMRGHDSGIEDGCFSPDGSRIATASRDGTVRIWSRSGEARHVCRNSKATVQRVRWSPDGSRILTIDADGTLRVWDLTSTPTASAVAGTPTVEAWFRADGTIVATTRNGWIRVWDQQHLKAPRLELHVPEIEVATAALSNAGRQIALGGTTPRLCLVDLSTKKTLRMQFESRHPKVVEPDVMTIAFSPDDRYVAVGAKDTSIRIYDVETLKEHASVKHWTPQFVRYHPSGRHLLVGAAYSPRAMFLRLSPGSPSLLTFKSDWLHDHNNKLSSGDYSPDGTLFLTASYDGTVRVYKTDDFAEYALISGHTDAITRAVFSPDGTSILTVSLDGTARLWPTDPMILARERKPRDMRDTEEALLLRELAR